MCNHSTFDSLKIAQFSMGQRSNDCARGEPGDKARGGAGWGDESPAMFDCSLLHGVSGMGGDLQMGGLQIEEHLPSQATGSYSLVGNCCLLCLKISKSIAILW